MTMMLRRSDSSGCGRPDSRSSLVRPNFCSVVKRMPPFRRPASSSRNWSRVITCSGASGSSSLASNVP